jgi:1-acyl-sn-glycerol-3-phosphate acyltransferase
MVAILRGAFFLLIVRPVLTVILGANVRRRELLPEKGPAIIVANHNSHLDTLTIMAMFRLRDLPRLRPVAAMDYFMRTKLTAWFAVNIIGIIPLARGGRGKSGGHPLEPCQRALDRGDILIVFPEGSRGEPETLSQFKNGVAHLVKARPQTPVHPLFMHGLGKALPKDSYLLVPFNCDVAVGEAFFWNGSVDAFMETLQARMTDLAAMIHMAPWE